MAQKKRFLDLFVVFFLLVSAFLTQPAPVSAQEGRDFSADVDGDGLPNVVEEGGWYNAAGGPYVTNSLDADSDDDGLTDGQEKLYDTHPLDDHQPGIYVEYEGSLKTRQYSAKDYHSTLNWPNWGWRQYGDRFISFGTVVVRRGGTFVVGGPADATIQIVKSLDSLTTLTPVRDVCAGRWRISVPTGGTVGKYTITVQEGAWSKSLKLYVIFELPAPTSSFTQAMINTFLYDDDPANPRDETGINLGEVKYTQNITDFVWIPGGAWINAGWGYQFNLQPFEPFVFEEHVIGVINGRTNQWDAARDLVAYTDKVTRFNYPRLLYTSWEVLHPKQYVPFNDWNQCSNIAGLLTAFERSAGIPARPFFTDWAHSSFDHSAEIWLNGAWYTARGYTKVESEGCGWNCSEGHIMPTTRDNWGRYHYKPWHSGGTGSSSTVMAADENWSWSGTGGGDDPAGHEYRWPSWDWDAIVRRDWFDTLFAPYWGYWGWTQEPQVTGTPPAWPAVTDFGIDVVPNSQTVAQTKTTSYTVNLTTASGFSNRVDITVTSGMPANTAYSFQPGNYCVPNCSRTLFITTTASTPLGTFQPKVKAYKTGLADKFDTVNLTVTSPPDFTIGASPDEQTVAPGQSADYTVVLTPLNGFNNTVYLSVTGQPMSSTVTFIPSDNIVPPGDRTLRVNTANDTPTGIYPLTIYGDSGALHHETNVNLIVEEGGALGGQATSAPAPATAATPAALPAIGALSEGGQPGLTVRGLQDYGVDLDGDGYFDQLVVEIEVNAPQAGTYWLEGQLGVEREVPALMGTGGLIAAAVVRADLAAGANTVRLVFEGLYLSAAKVDGPYVLQYLSITDVEDPGRDDFANNALGQWSSVYTTAAYRAYDFENRGATLSGEITEEGLDADRDGLYEALTLNVGLNIFVPGTYTVQGVLYDSREQFIAQATWTGTGSTAALQFEGLAGTVGPYRLKELNLLNAEGEVIDGMFEAYTTQQVVEAEGKTHIVDRADWGEMGAQAILPGPYSAAGRDLDGDGLYDLLVITATLEIGAGEGGQAYRIEGWLVDTNGSLVSWAVSAPQVLAEGVHSLPLAFDGRIINEHGVDGPFTLVALKALPGDTYDVLSKVDVAYTTSAYDHDDFEGPVVAPTARSVFADDMEHGTSNWTWQSPWSLNSSVWHSYSHAWKAEASDSRTGSLTTISLDISHCADPVLRLRTCYTMQSSNDAGYLEVSTNGLDWTRVATYTNSTPHWSTEFLELKSFDATSSLQLRFKANSQNGLLWYVDDVALSAWLDSDGDGLSDVTESALGTNPDNPDTDGDGLTDGQEMDDYRTDPKDPDSDDDGLPDGWEVDNGFDPRVASDASGDPDGDGLTNLEEYQHGADPHNPDTDGDGLSDGDEVHTYGTDPNDADSDDDGLTDAAEVNTHHTNPNNADSDNDGLNDGAEINTYHTDPNNADSDDDGLPDGWEVDNSLDPLDGSDADDDPDNDGLTNLEEYQKGSDPHNPDTDGDGIPDGEDPSPAGIISVYLPVILK